MNKINQAVLDIINLIKHIVLLIINIFDEIKARNYLRAMS